VTAAAMILEDANALRIDRGGIKAGSAGSTACAAIDARAV
jgi:hypothetical protein